jgi:hypothetical protein
VSVDLESSYSGLDLFKPTKKDLMTSNIISRPACLAELASNPKSFFNCPDLHGGPGLPEGSFQSGELDSPSVPEETITFSEAIGKP